MGRNTCLCLPGVLEVPDTSDPSTRSSPLSFPLEDFSEQLLVCFGGKIVGFDVGDFDLPSVTKLIEVSVEGVVSLNSSPASQASRVLVIVLKARYSFHVPFSIGDVSGLIFAK